MIGRLLGGRYQVIEILAVGGFGQTYIAKDTHRPGNPSCVVKHLKPASINSSYLQNARRLFRSEAETLEKLGNHDQIPRLLAYFEENQEFYLVQDFILGHPLSNELQPGIRWTESKVCQLLKEVLEILEFVHNHGVIHRDIKPNNIIQCQQDGRYVLVDFGSVKQAWTQVVTTQGETNTSFTLGMPVTIGIGTPGYMPTEQVRGRPRLSSDIYALGIICIQALTGLHPTQLQEEANTGELLWVHEAQVSNGLAAILAKMVRYHFTDRYQTAAEALQALQLLNHPVAAKINNTNEVRRSPQPSTPQPIVVSPKPVPAPTSHTDSNLPPWEWHTKHQTVVVSGQSAQNPIASQQIVSDTIANSADSIINSQANSSKAHNKSNSLQLPSASNLGALQPTIHLPLEAQAASSNQNAITAATDVGKTQVDAKAKHPAIPGSRNQRQLRLGAGITAVFISLVASYAIYWQPRPNVRETLEQVESLKAEGNSQACINQAAKISRDSPLYSNAQTLLHECQLAQAKQLASDRAFKAAITEASLIPPNSASYQEAQQLINQMSNTILGIATTEYQSGKLNNAITMAQTIPKTSFVYQKAQKAIEQWNQDWKKNSLHLSAANAAIEQGKWQNALNSAKQVVDAPYWQKQVEPIIQKAESEIAADKNSNNSKPVSSTATRQTTTTPKRQIQPTTSQTTTTPRRQTQSPTRQTATTPRRRTQPAIRQSTPTTPRRIKRSANKPQTRNTLKRQNRVNQPQTRNNSKPKVRRAAPPKRSYKWTTKTVP